MKRHGPAGLIWLVIDDRPANGRNTVSCRIFLWFSLLPMPIIIILPYVSATILWLVTFIACWLLFQKSSNPHITLQCHFSRMSNDVQRRLSKLKKALHSRSDIVSSQVFHRSTSARELAVWTSQEIQSTWNRGRANGQFLHLPEFDLKGHVCVESRVKERLNSSHKGHLVMLYANTRWKLGVVHELDQHGSFSF